MDQEQLEGLGGSISELDEQLTPRTPEEQAAKDKAEAEADPVNQARAWGALAYSVGGMLSIIAPELKSVYTEDACLAWGTAVVPVAEKYGWSGPSNVPELGLLMATVPLALPSFFIVRQKLRDMRKAKAAADEARTVDNGVAVPAEGFGGSA